MSFTDHQATYTYAANWKTECTRACVRRLNWGGQNWYYRNSIKIQGPNRPSNENSILYESFVQCQKGCPYAWLHLIRRLFWLEKQLVQPRHFFFYFARNFKDQVIDTFVVKFNGSIDDALENMFCTLEEAILLQNFIFREYLLLRLFTIILQLNCQRQNTFYRLIELLCQHHHWVSYSNFVNKLM